MRQLFVFVCLALLSLTIYSCGEKITAAAAGSKTENKPERTDRFGGLALYTLREDLGKDVKGTLQKVADAGYEYVEAAGYSNGKFYGMEPAAFKAYLAEVGLTPISSHHGDITVETASQAAKDLKAAGFQYLVIPIPPMGAFGYDNATKSMSMTQSPSEVLGNIKAIAAKTAAEGVKCLYHNHDFEFRPGADGITPIDYFLENTEPGVLDFQMDLYWVTKAGADPVAYFDKYPGRFIAWHVKDMDDRGRFAPVGEGNIDFARIYEARAKSGMKFYLVEQDQCYNHTALEAMAISHGNLKGFGFE